MILLSFFDKAKYTTSRGTRLYKRRSCLKFQIFGRSQHEFDKLNVSTLQLLVSLIKQSVRHTKLKTSLCARPVHIDGSPMVDRFDRLHAKAASNDFTYSGQPTPDKETTCNRTATGI